MQRVLIANRGEIALRVMKAARALGYETVAVYSDADAASMHVEAADQAYRIGGAAVADSYLNMDAVLAAAKATNADAVHPGYGFLAENADFVRACKKAGLNFVGPDADAMEALGNKRQARLKMNKEGVPCLPGYEGDAQDDKALMKAAQGIGFPLMVKAAAGGGGRGMRLVAQESDLEAALRGARSEAQDAFGSDELILEKAATSVKHIEIQVLADGHGEVLYIGERDCSSQRRYQKVIEEAPSPSVDEKLRQAMGEAAVKVAKSVGYVGAGTVEFLLDGDGNFYFLEMNTRIQVEHPVSEMITGIDLVAWQLRIAAGEKLSIQQKDVGLCGHAIEARLYAEDPDQNFIPQSGPLHRLSLPEDLGLRLECALQSGDEVTPYYDPMIAKIIAYGANRDEALRKLDRALGQTQVFGIKTNKDYLRRILQHADFAAGGVTTDWLEAQDFMANALPNELVWALAALVHVNLHSGNDGWSNALWLQSAAALEHGGEKKTLWVEQDKEAFRVHVDEGTHFEFAGVSKDGEQLFCRHEGKRLELSFLEADGEVWLSYEGQTYCFGLISNAAAAEEGEEDNRLQAPMNGRVVAVPLASGAEVEAGATVVVVEAMKMEHEIQAPKAGKVSEILVEVGQQVAAREILAILELDEGSSEHAA